MRCSLFCAWLAKRIAGHSLNHQNRWTRSAPAEALLPHATDWVSLDVELCDDLEHAIEVLAHLLGINTRP